MTAPFVKVDHALLDHAEALGLDNDHLRVVMALMSHDWQNGNPCRPPQKDLASRCNASVRTVQRRCDHLVKLKLIERTRPSRQHAYRYDLQPLRKRLADLAPEASDTTAGVMSDAEPEATTVVRSRGDNSCQVPRRQQVSPDVDAVTKTQDVAPLPPSGGRARDRGTYDQDLATFTAENFPDVHPGYVAFAAQEARRSKKLATVENVRAAMKYGEGSVAA